MQCARCETSISEGEKQEHLDRMLCEDCYRDALSPAKTCDLRPAWARCIASSLP
jgi:hypothetical protein